MSKGSSSSSTSTSTSGSGLSLAGAAFVTTTLAFLAFQATNRLQRQRDSQRQKQRDTEIETEIEPERESARESVPAKRRVHILYGTTTGTAKTFANTLSRHLEKKCDAATVSVSVSNLKDYFSSSDSSNDPPLAKEDIVLFICSTWTNGKAPESCQAFFDWLQDQAFDFRVSKDSLSAVEFGVFGLGGELYGPNFCKATKDLDEQLERLGAVRLLPFASGDDGSNLEQAFYKWNSKIAKLLEKRFPATEMSKTDLSKKGSIKSQGKSLNSDSIKTDAAPESTCCGGSNEEGEGECCQPPSNEFDEEEEEDRINNAFVDIDDIDEEGVVDLEEIGPAITRMKAESDKQKLESTDIRREMVTKLQRKALTKEGYKIIGSHSAVKLCRWTKNQLRGRGGCYKHSFYGITSYQCMEATPSLACANKCVFCWRHHKNPVGTEWRWKEDDPAHIVEEAIRLHVGMVHEMKGVPGVQPERLLDAHTVRHCALSLVGEPIMYPRINEMLHELHNRDISTFLVTNAQFPERIQQLDPVTQLYVSVDAATKDSLKAIDRPLFKDYWERFLDSLRALRDKKQRTVYRMTLVKSWNMTEVEDYVQLIEAGLPDFIEIKAVTYCGKSDASSLTMENVPWHKDVCTYGEEICKRLQGRQVTNVVYNIATEHEHSCCILIAREDKFKKGGEWHTWIDYPKFSQLMQEYYSSNGKCSFTSEDYVAKTPTWAVYQSSERGFDPVEQRWRRNKAGGAQEEIPYQSTESGCG